MVAHQAISTVSCHTTHASANSTDDTVLQCLCDGHSSKDVCAPWSRPCMTAQGLYLHAYAVLQCHSRIEHNVQCAVSMQEVQVVAEGVSAMTYSHQSYSMLT